ncbi:Hypothetical predicted protein [Mytilus galloprovincialis]|uniref:Uncharacterized protein n=1 Tax=Mytilus galloprovincialis TaxID=29158 RepID=A0A8B6GMP4_MYTGA|nr:Hypothetical predicted protein [Mytilus galloprovincialis]
MTDRACGIARKATTTQSHLTAVKFWLPTGLTRQALLDLEKIGTLDGESEACYPAGIPPQLGWVPAISCRKGYLAPPSASPCRPAHHALPLRDNEDGEQESEGGCPHRQGGEPRAWRGHSGSGASADSQVPGRTTTHQSQDGDREGRERRAAVQGREDGRRNILCLQLLLSNAKRAGDITHLRRADVLAAVAVDGTDIEIELNHNKL